MPTQYLIGIFMMILSYSIDDILGDAPGEVVKTINNQTDDVLITTSAAPNVHLLTFIFICLNFLAATQDIAVDGWALTILQRRFLFRVAYN